MTHRDLKTSPPISATQRWIVAGCWMSVLSAFAALGLALILVPTRREFEFAPLLVTAYGATFASLVYLFVALVVAGLRAFISDARFAAILVTGVVASGATVHALGGVVLPLLADWKARSAIVVDVDPLDPTILRIHGPLPADLDQRVGDLLNSMPPSAFDQIVWVDMASEGGHLAAAVRTVELLRRAGLRRMRASGPCLSACALMWMHGERRLVLPAGSLGFHTPVASDGQSTAALQDAVESFLHCETGDAMFSSVAARWPSSGMFSPDVMWLAELGLIGASTTRCRLVLPGAFLVTQRGG